MAEDFRLTIDFDDEGDGTDLVEWLAAFRSEREERERFGDRVVVSRDGGRVFLYTGAEEAAREAERVVLSRLAERGLQAHAALDRWHPVEEVWKDVSEPLPQGEGEFRAEHARQQAREAAHSQATGYAEWEVRVELPRREETDTVADRLESEGIAVVRRSNYLLAGAANQDEAVALAERLRGELPPAARIEVEPGGGMVWEVMPQNPFAFFGGLGT